eukprot:14417777-Ditylum_brightwellii.AAC.1
MMDMLQRILSLTGWLLSLICLQSVLYKGTTMGKTKKHSELHFLLTMTCGISTRRKMKHLPT